MESRNITLTLDKAKEWYKQGGELKEVAPQAFKEEELVNDELPKTWEEFCKKITKKEEPWYNRLEWYISDDCEISYVNRSDWRNREEDKNLLPSKEAAEAHLALMQLHQLRDYYRQGWVPDWSNNDLKFGIVTNGKKASIGTGISFNYFLSFQSREIAEQFLENFRDLIEKAVDLI